MPDTVNRPFSLRLCAHGHWGRLHVDNERTDEGILEEKLYPFLPFLQVVESFEKRMGESGKSGSLGRFKTVCLPLCESVLLLG